MSAAAREARKRLEIFLDQHRVAVPIVAASMVGLLAVVLAMGNIPRRVWRPLVPRWLRTASFARDDAVKGWTLGLGERSAAELSIDAAGRGARVVVQELGGVEPWRVQLNHADHDVEPDFPYVLRFRARADEPRELGVGLARNRPPWDAYGPSQTMDLTTEWRSFTLEFAPLDGDARTRVYFNVAARPIPVEVADLTLAVAETSAPAVP